MRKILSTYRPFDYFYTSNNWHESSFYKIYPYLPEIRNLSSTNVRNLLPQQRVRLIKGTLLALRELHERNIVHADIKPENILMNDGRPMVADFGIALAVSAAAGGRMTETGLSLGTPHYMSPEQATAEKEITARSDVYSVGSVLYEMLTGHPPFTGAVAQQIIMKIIMTIT